MAVSGPTSRPGWGVRKSVVQPDASGRFVADFAVPPPEPARAWNTEIALLRDLFRAPALGIARPTELD